MKFITIETDLHNNVEKELINSCNINNIDIQIVGKGTEWNGFITKWQLMVDYLTQINEEFVCLTDARDVLYMSDRNTIYNTFIENFDRDSIVFNGETQCHPEPEFAKSHPNQHKKYKYLNAGCVIGNRKTLLEVAKQCIKLYETSGCDHDQYLIQKLFIDGKLNITIDYDCKIFQCV